jgi:curved DNA-binding protein CbpA
VADYFELLAEPRRPWIDPDQLKQKFLTLSGDLHPDRFHGTPVEEKRRAQERYTELNSAYQCLLQPKDRLAHLLELESGAKPKAIQTAPAAFMDLFLDVGNLCREGDKFLAEKRTASPLVQVSLFERGQQLADKIQAVQRRVRAVWAQHEAALRELNVAWEKAPPIGDSLRTAALPLADLEDRYRAFSYLARWSAQLQERIIQLAL